jgi:hypothetical protein
MARSSILVVAVSVCMAGCLDRTRVNTECRWSADDARPLDVQQWPQQRHLYEDVAIAEELAIRYADHVHKERFGSDAHGGLIEGGRLRDRCMATLVNAIANTHNLTPDRVEQARADGYRDTRWDAGVLLSFACLYGLIAWATVRTISRRIPVEDGWFALAAPLLASLPVGVAAVQLFALWGALWEVIRVGNGHISSYRSARSPWAAHLPALWVAAVLVFMAAASLRYRRSRLSGKGFNDA